MTPASRYRRPRPAAPLPAAPLPVRVGCARWLGDWWPRDPDNIGGRWCDRVDGLRDYVVGPLCPEHRPGGHP